MELTEFEYLNKFLTVLDCCNATAIVEIDTTLSDSEKGMFDFINSRDQFELTVDNKAIILDSIGKNSQDDFCYHFRIFKDGQLICQSFDHCSLLHMHPDFFVLNES